MSLDWILAALPWLALLACPAMMFWMMRGGSGRSCHGDTDAPRDGDKKQEIRALKARLEELGSRTGVEERPR